MLKRIFGKKKDEEQSSDPIEDNAIDVAALNLSAQEIVQALITAMKTESGVHIESLLAMLGSFAGFCCIDVTLKKAADMGASPKEAGLMDIECSDGKHYFFGESTNSLLAGSDHSILSLVAGVMNQLGSQDYPDFSDLVKYSAENVGSEDFGVPRVPDNHQPMDRPVNYVRDIWPAIALQLEQRSPDYLGRILILGLAIQHTMRMAKDVIDPALAGKLVMECAVPMSRLNPGDIWPDT